MTLLTFVAILLNGNPLLSMTKRETLLEPLDSPPKVAET